MDAGGSPFVGLWDFPVLCDLVVGRRRGYGFTLVEAGRAHYLQTAPVERVGVIYFPTDLRWKVKFRDWVYAYSRNPHSPHPPIIRDHSVPPRARWWGS